MKTTRIRFFALSLAVALLPMMGACARDTEEEAVETSPPATTTASDAVRVTSVDVGRSIGADKKVNDNAATDEFGRNDTIYVSVDTEGNASGAALSARWTFEDGQVVDESSQTISATGPAVTEFHISKPDGFPTGKYKVEIRLNGQTVETKDFEVK
ncbi:MAG TPA: hypothetical protein VGD27_06885 [Longimicrobiales bacterium]